VLGYSEPGVLDDHGLELVRCSCCPCYIRPADESLWLRAEQYAKARRLSMSALVLTALERFLESEGSK
jgi:hypothetical protein